MEKAVKFVKGLVFIIFGIPIILGIVLFVWMSIDIPLKTTYDIKDIDVKNKKQSNMYDCFPDEIIADNVIDFVAVYNGFGIDQYFLSIKYSDKDFQSELNRLNEYSLNNQFLDYDENCKLFNYPTYIAYYWSGNEYQYICIDYENRTIAYVYVYQVSVENILFDTKYLPKNFVINGDSETKDLLYGGLKVFSDEDEIVWESVLNNA